MTKLEPELKAYILALPKSRKLKMLKEAQDTTKLGEFLSLLNVYLEAPITEGGISSDDISAYLNTDLKFSRQ